MLAQTEPEAQLDRRVSTAGAILVVHRHPWVRTLAAVRVATAQVLAPLPRWRDLIGAQLTPTLATGAVPVIQLPVWSFAIQDAAAGALKPSFSDTRVDALARITP